jgi:putative alpha-1,2-mannosidase
MKKLFIFSILFIATNAFAQKQNTKPSQTSDIRHLTTLVNPFIGTGGHGHTFPGPTMPFGACQVGPDTRLEGWDGCSGYHYSDSVIYGFSHTHLSGTGCSDYGDILLMPVTKEMQLDKYQYASKFSHAREKAHAGYYEVFLDEPKVKVELTSTLHGGYHRYKYPIKAEQFVVLDLKHRDELIDSRMVQIDDFTIKGYRFSKAWAKNQKVFFEIKFSKPIESIQYQENKKDNLSNALHLEKSHQCIIKFQKDKTVIANPNIEVKVAISGVDEEGAHLNLAKEMPKENWDFDQYRKLCEQEWEKELSKIKVSQIQNSTSSQEKLVIFYTALYHSMIHPSIFNDVDGRYRGRDDKIYNTEGKFNYYTVFSLWDTYRALHPLLTIIDKKRTNDFINTFIKQYEQGGRLPIWELSSNETNCMIGYHVVSVIWDAYNKGIRDYDVNKAFEAMKDIATDYTDYTDENSKNQIPNSKNNIKSAQNFEFGVFDLKLSAEARSRCADADALESYNRYGYVRCDDSHESVSKTLEYAYDDWCIAQMANALGKKKDFEYYMNRSHNWMNVYDPTTGFMRARKNGTLYEPFSPYTVDNNYTEANSWQYSYYVPHEMEKLIGVSGMVQNFEKNLDNLFSAKEKTEGREQADITGLIGQYAHGNEPSHHIAFLYRYAQNQSKETEITNRIANEFYKNLPDGLIGNEDCGQMSAWYVLKSIGVYPTCPGNNKYTITEPLFDKIILNNKTEINKIDTSKSKYKSFCNNGSSNEISHFDLQLEKKININSIDINTTSYGIVSAEDFNSVPYILPRKSIFKNNTLIEFGVAKNGFGHDAVDIFYSVNNEDYQLYSKPLQITENTSIKFYSTSKNDNYPKSPIQTASFTKIPTDRKIILQNQYNPSYHAGGAEGLMDGIYGKLNWRAGDWQGYQGEDVAVVMALDKPTAIKKIAANFLEDQNAWIFYPKSVSFYASNDSINWTLLENILTNKSDHTYEASISKFQVSESNLEKLPFTNRQPTTRYIKMVAQNFGPMPLWHEGKGNPTFIFIDELIVD